MGKKCQKHGKTNFTKSALDAPWHTHAKEKKMEVKKIAKDSADEKRKWKLLINSRINGIWKKSKKRIWVYGIPYYFIIKKSKKEFSIKWGFPKNQKKEFSIKLGFSKNQKKEFSIQSRFFDFFKNLKGLRFIKCDHIFQLFCFIFNPGTPKRINSVLPFYPLWNSVGIFSLIPSSSTCN